MKKEASRRKGEKKAMRHLETIRSKRLELVSLFSHAKGRTRDRRQKQ